MYEIAHLRFLLSLESQTRTLVWLRRLIRLCCKLSAIDHGLGSYVSCKLADVPLW